MNVTTNSTRRFRTAALARDCSTRATTSSTRLSATSSSPPPSVASAVSLRARAAGGGARTRLRRRVLRAPLDDVRRELDEYFAGRREAFDLALDLRVGAVQRARSCRARARAVRPTETYGALARRSAVRAQPAPSAQ